MAPTTNRGSVPALTGSGSRASGGSCERSLSTREETDERASLVRSVVADRAPQHRIARLQSIQHSGDRRGVCDFERYLAADSRQSPQVRRERDPDRSHGSVWTSTEDTLGKYSAIASHVSPESVDAYTCPPVVPK